MEPQDLVTVYTVSNAIEAEIVKNALEDEGIQCVIEGEHQAGEAGLIGIEIKLQVAPADAARAKAFIEAHENSHDDNEEDGLTTDESLEEGIQDLERRGGIQEK